MELKKKKKLGKIEKPPFHCLIPRIECINIMGCGEGSQGKEGGEDRREGRKERQERKKGRERERKYCLSWKQTYLQ